MWNRLKAKWRAHNEKLATRERRREAVDAEPGGPGGDPAPDVVGPYQDQDIQPSTGLSHPEPEEPPKD
jgi:hypothetical protein